jgi:hypothetical protein
MLMHTPAIDVLSRFIEFGIDAEQPARQGEGRV